MAGDLAGDSGMAEPRVWKERERLDGKIVECVTAIITTRGCAWRRCYMCGYTRESREVSEAELIEQISRVLAERGEVVKIFTSGSFFDDSEVPRSVRLYLKERLGDRKLIVESRPEFITPERLADFEGVNLEIGIGLETADDFIREHCVNKGFSFSDFLRAAKFIREHGFRVKVYLLLKPPFLSEREAIEDAVRSIEKVADVADVVSLNLTNVQRGTLVERLWKAKLYRPPWLWSAVEVLKSSDVEIICDPVAAGKSRGPHNCGRCDVRVERAIREFSLTQDRSLLNVSCDCVKVWKKVLELEDYSRVPIL